MLVVEKIFKKHQKMPFSWGVGLVTWGQTISFCSVGAGVMNGRTVGFEVHCLRGDYMEYAILYTHT